MNKFNPAIRFTSHLSAIIMLSLVVLLGRPAVAYGDDWKDQRCKEIQNGLTSLEQRAPQIRKEIAEREEEMGLLQRFQKGSQAVYLSTILNTVPLVPRAIIGSYPGMTPELADMLVNRVSDLQAYVNQREIRVRQTELPRLQEEQTNVGRQIFLLRDESESLKCQSPLAGGNKSGEANLLQRIVGEWEAEETRSVIEITQDGNGVLSPDNDAEGKAAELGLKPGDTILANFRIVGDTLEAELTIRASKENCPSLEAKRVIATIKFQSDDTFILTAPSYAYCIRPCRWTEQKTSTLTRTYHRI